LRKTKIDELPQILNFLKGDLNLVGWRPVPRQLYATFPHDIRAIYDTIGPGLIGICYALPKAQRTEEGAFKLYKKFYGEYKKSPKKTSLKYAALVAKNIFR
jgi:lipopolysaccharide/colanic/teichoic acid biosynthesis glycosyltransferase